MSAARLLQLPRLRRAVEITIWALGAPCERTRRTTLRRTWSRRLLENGVRATTEMPLREYRSGKGTPEEWRRDRIQALVKAYK